MANTYAINTTRGKEFEVEDELRALGLKPWVPRRLTSKKITQQKERTWYDTPYVPKLIFCIFPAVYWTDVLAIKHIVGKPFPLSRGDISGRRSFDIQRPDGTSKHIPAVWGLDDFKAAVLREYEDAQRLMSNNLYQCAYKPGQALEIISGPFKDMPASFNECVQSAHEEYATLKVEIEMMGGTTKVGIPPDQVQALG